MKKRIFILLLSTTFTLLPSRSHAVVWVVIQEALKQVLLAMDAQIQRLQNKTIGLQNAQKKLENTLSKLKLKEISEWAEKQRKLYDEYYQELWKVKDVISTYKHVRQIIKRQADLVNEYKRVYQLCKEDKHFAPEEIKYMGRVYEGILTESIRNIEPIFLVIKSFDLQMSDASRIEIISRAARQVEENIADLRRFNNENMLLSIQRSRDAREISAVRALYGLQ